MIRAPRENLPGRRQDDFTSLQLSCAVSAGHCDSPLPHSSTPSSLTTYGTSSSANTPCKCETPVPALPLIREKTLGVSSGIADSCERTQSWKNRIDRQTR